LIFQPSNSYYQFLYRQRRYFTLTTKTPERAMIIVAHPDDPEFFCGGLIACWCAAGSQVAYLILTNGDKGSDNPDMTPEKLIAARREEQQAAADILGVKKVIFFNEPDGELRPTLELREHVVAEIRRWMPDVVVTLDPTRYFSGNVRVNHADHRAVGEVTLDAIFPATGNRMYHPELLAEGLEPHQVKQVYLAGTEHPTLWVDISEVLETKIRAILCHSSQIKEPAKLPERMRERSKAIDEYGREVQREGYRVLNLT
jgi:LmbE family N-acetylglucosaminyl deacetylase